MQKGQTTAILTHFSKALADLEAAGAILIDIDEGPSTPDDYGNMAYNLLKYEFKDGINSYLASTSVEQVSTRTLTELIAFNENYKARELALFDQAIFIDSNDLGALDSEEYLITLAAVQKATREDGIDRLLQQHDVSVLVAPSGPIAPIVDPINGDVWPNDWPGFGSHAARAGYPHATVPMGGINHLSVGLSFIGGENTDAKILSYAYAYEQISMHRLEPLYFRNAESISSIAEAMKSFGSEEL